MHANTLFLLASAPYAAAHLHPVSQYGSAGSNGSCYDPSTHIAKYSVPKLSWLHSFDFL